MACFPRTSTALAFAACLVAASGEVDKRVLDSGSDFVANGTVSQRMPLKVLRSVSTGDYTPFQVGEPVRVRHWDSDGWSFGTVGELMPLKVCLYGSTSAVVYQHIQHTGEAPFKVGERVRVRHWDSDDWSFGTVGQLVPLKVFRDGSNYASVFGHMERGSAARFAQPLIRGAYLLIMCANLLVLIQ